jgi:hypothetical protein
MQLAELALRERGALSDAASVAHLAYHTIDQNSRVFTAACNAVCRLNSCFVRHDNVQEVD